MSWGVGEGRGKKNWVAVAGQLVHKAPAAAPGNTSSGFLQAQHHCSNITNSQTPRERTSFPIYLPGTKTSQFPEALHLGPSNAPSQRQQKLIRDVPRPPQLLGTCVDDAIFCSPHSSPSAATVATNSGRT